MKTVAVDPSAAGRLVLAEVPAPTAGPADVLVRVKAFSLNRGEVRSALSEAAAGFRPGWDFAGVVERAAADGSGPGAGMRVVGIAAFGAWSEFVASPAMMLAALPDAVSFEAAASLPVAGLTALYAVRKRAKLEGARVLVTGASGGVGVYGVQLAKHGGGQVTAAIRNPANEALVRRLGATAVAVGEDLSAAPGPFDLVVDGVGGRTLAAALGKLAPGGTCVIYGASENAVVTFDSVKFRPGGTSLYGLYLGYELQFEPPSRGLGHLAGLVADGALDPMVKVTAPWAEIAGVAQDLIDRRFAGKAVMTVA
jgi:NADPH:quinone reductase-like Zn-dependent oxidoreductase